MAARRGGSGTAEQRYWAARVRSPAFKRALVGMIEDELRALANARVGDVLERKVGERIIRRWNRGAVDRAAITELALDVNRRLTRRLARRRDSLLELLDPALVAQLDGVFEQFVRLTPRAEEFIALLMGQEFMRGLFTDLIYSALVSFYRRVDPLFGGLGVRVLEPQIKSFIGYFMPMVQGRVAAFVAAPANQRIAAAFARAVARQLLGVPLRGWAELAAAGPRQAVEAFVRRAAANARLGSLTEQVALAVWDELYTAIAPRKIGDLLGLDPRMWRAEDGADALVPALARPAVLAFIVAEMAGRRSAGMLERVAENDAATVEGRGRPRSRRRSPARRSRRPAAR